jgi:hypothetical protein
MTFDELRHAARLLLRDLKQQKLRTGLVSPVFRAYYTGGGHKDFTLPGGTEHVMDDGRMKEILFDMLRRFTAAGGVEAWLFATDVFFAKTTEEGIKHIDEFTQHQDRGFTKLAKMGWVVVEESLLLTLQTEAEVGFLKQMYTTSPKLIWLGPPLEDQRGPQSEFGGRQKMWGATRDDITGRDVSRSDGPVGVELITEDPT